MTSKNIYRIFLCGDVMTGRGIDQILSHPSNPTLYEPYVKDAREYVFLAEHVNGKIPFPVAMNYIWGDALNLWNIFKPDTKIINLETAITQSNEAWPEKGINYRMHPLNINVLTTADIDVCTLANNHILDWSYSGLKETVATLNNAHIQYAGVGENITQAMKPVILQLSDNKRILIFSAAMPSSGVPRAWSATAARAGVYFLPDINHDVIRSIAENINHYKQTGDIAIFSIHWGSNWGYKIPDAFRDLAHGMIDEANVDVVFGHSSHHPRPIELYNEKPILYGCGDFINDYEGISGMEEYRGDLAVMYFLDFDCESLAFKTMTLIPIQIKKFRLQLATEEDCKWMLKRFQQFHGFETRFEKKENYLVLENS